MNSRIPRGFLRLYHLRILEFHVETLGSSPRMTGNLEFLEIASSHSLLAITRILEFLDCFAFSKHRNDAGNFRIPFEILKKNTP